MATLYYWKTSAFTPAKKKTTQRLRLTWPADLTCLSTTHLPYRTAPTPALLALQKFCRHTPANYWRLKLKAWTP